MKKLMFAAFLAMGLAVTAHAAGEIQERIAAVKLSTTSTAGLAFSGPGVAYGLILSSGTTSNNVVLRDTATANSTSTQLLPIANFTTVPQVLLFPKPIRIYNGLSINLNTATSGETAAVVYRKGNTQ